MCCTWPGLKCCVGADNIPYVSEKHVAADMTSLFTHTKRLYGSEGNLQGNTLRNLQQTWLSQCSDKIQRQRKVNLVELHDAWEYADASDIRTLKHAQQRLRDAIEDTSVAKPNNATALMRAVQRAVYVFLVSNSRTQLAKLTQACLFAMCGIAPGQQACKAVNKTLIV